MSQKYIIPLLFLLLLLGGCWLLPDYGLSWDEHPQREHGLVSADYINEVFDLGRYKERDWLPLEDYKYQHYGVLFQLVAYYAGKYLELDSLREQYLLRHYLGWLWFWTGCIFFFKFLRLRFSTVQAGVGVLLLLLTPRIFAHAFFNPKDTVLLAGMIIAFYTHIRFLQKMNLKYALLHALACAVVINIRITGMVMPAFTILFLGLEMWRRFFSDRRDVPPLRWLLMSVIWAVVTVGLTVAFWPYLWENPREHFIEAFTVMSAYPWTGKIMLYGQTLLSTELPWYYIPAWMSATVPPLFLAAGAVGLVMILAKTLRNLWQKKVPYADTAGMIDLLAFGFFVGTLFVVIYKGSVLYNGWRQMYFIYPAFLTAGLVAVFGAADYLRRQPRTLLKKIGFGILLGAVALQSLFILVFYVKNHPWQHLYFNVFAGKNTTERFEADYWGVAYKQAYEKILEIDDRDTIRVAAMQENFPGRLNYDFLPPATQTRLQFETDGRAADYLIVDYIGEGVAQRRRDGAFPFDQETAFEFKTQGNPFLRTVRIRPSKEE